MSEPTEMEFHRFEGGKRVTWAAACAAAAALALCGWGFTRQPHLAASSWLLATVFWSSVCLGSLVWLALLHALGVRWHTVLRRQAEHHLAALWACALGLVGLASCLREAYVWADAEALRSLPEATRAAVAATSSWLHAPGFVTRAGLLMVALLAMAWWLNRNTRLQEARAADARLHQQTRSFSAAALLPLAIAGTLAPVDWLMSLEPGWSSTAFVFYFLAGCLVTALAVLVLAVVVPFSPQLAAARVGAGHLDRLAQLLAVTIVAWAWFGLCVVSVETPSQLAWLAERGLSGSHTSGRTWRPLLLLLFAGRAVLPLFGLALRSLRRNRTFLTALSVWTMAMHFVDLFVVIKPALRWRRVDWVTPEATFTWTDVCATVGLGALCLTAVLLRMRGRYGIPLNDVGLPESLELK